VTAWTSYRVEPIGLELDVVDGVPVDAELGETDGSALQFADELQIGVWYGAGGSIDTWARGIAESWPRAVLGPEETVTVGEGLTARRRVALLPADHATGGFERDDGAIELRVRETPAREVTAVALERDGIHALVSVTSPAERRADAAHVLASLRASSG
jgi:hypothetical protein